MSTLRPEPPRLQSLRRARARMLIARDSEQKPRWRTVLVHPVFVGAVAAALGLISGIISSSLNSQREVAQYWREQRLTAYTDYSFAAQDLVLAEAAAINEMYGSSRRPPATAETRARAGQLVADLDGKRDALLRKTQPILVLGSEPVIDEANIVLRTLTFGYQPVRDCLISSGSSAPLPASCTEKIATVPDVYAMSRYGAAVQQDLGIR